MSECVGSLFSEMKVKLFVEESVSGALHLGAYDLSVNYLDCACAWRNLSEGSRITKGTFRVMPTYIFIFTNAATQVASNGPEIVTSLNLINLPFSYCLLR